MKVTFNGYTFFDPNSKDKDTHAGTEQNYSDYKFDESKFNQLISNRQYEDAANYAAQFHFNDPEKQRQNENYILNLRREGRKLGAIYGRIDNDEARSKIEFADNVFVNGGLEQAASNPYTQKFVELKSSLGSNYRSRNGFTGRPEGDKVEATSLSITFEPEKQYGIFGWDWTAKDNTTASVEKFYADSGLNEVQLKSAGVEVIHKDGRTTLKFEKSNPLANQIIYNTPTYNSGGDLGGGSSYWVKVHGYDAKGNMLPEVGHQDIKDMQDIINDTQSTKNSYFQKINLTDKLYSSTIGGELDDNLTALNNALASGQITDTEYQRRLKTECGYIEEAIKTLGSGGYEMYSNSFNDKSTDESLQELSNEERAQVIQMISAANPKTLHFNAMVSNGTIGTLITVDADRADDKNINDSSKPNDIAKTRRWQVFIPGFMQEQAQAKINRNTTTRAAQEINEMQNWGYAYKCTDGTEIYVDENGQFYSDGQILSASDAVRKINKNMIVEDATSQLQFQFLNNKGELYNEDGYEKMARLTAVKAVNELYPGISFTDDTGKALTVDEIFARKGTGPTLADKYAKTTRYEVYTKYQELFDIYDKLMNGLIYYK
jgi:hypothetical protein